MKINCKIALKDLAGKPLKVEETIVTLGQALSNILVSSKEGGKMKLFILAQDLYKKDSLEVDASDLALIKKTVASTEIYNALVAGQCEQILEEIKEDKKLK